MINFYENLDPDVYLNMVNSPKHKQCIQDTRINKILEKRIIKNPQKIKLYLSFIRSRPEIFCEKGVLKNFVKFTRNICVGVSFLIQLQTAGKYHFGKCIKGLKYSKIPVETGRKLNVHATFRRCLGRLLNVLCTFNLCPVSTGRIAIIVKISKDKFLYTRYESTISFSF